MEGGGAWTATLLGPSPWVVAPSGFLKLPLNIWISLEVGGCVYLLVVWGGRIFPGVPVDISGGKGPKEEGPLPWFFFQSLILMGEGLSGVSG